MDSNCSHFTYFLLLFFFVFIKLTFIWGHKKGEEQKVVAFSGKVNHGNDESQIFFPPRLYICTNTYQNVYLFPHFMGPRTFKNTFRSQSAFFRNKRFMLDEMFQRNASKFAIHLEYKNPCSLFSLN